MSTLYEISEELLAIEEALASGELDRSEAELQAWAEQLVDDRAERVDATARFIQELTRRAEGRKAEAQRLAELARIDSNLAELLHQLLYDHMKAMGLKKLETERFRLTRAGNGGKLPLEINPDLDLGTVPSYLLRQELDKEAVRRELEANKTLSWARFGERGEHLRIK